MADSGNKRDISLKCGAEHFIDYQTEETTQVVKDLTDGGCHLV
jgi:NADPH:quinone reductase-like Zn-dependent oxidoreductase